MSIYEASRFSDGNQIFPAKIILKEDTVLLKIPGLFDGKEKSIPYRLITSIEINGGMLSFCEIVIKTSRSGKIVAKGFSQSTAKEIQAAINRKINLSKNSTNKSTSSTIKSSNSDNWTAKDEKDLQNLLLDLENIGTDAENTLNSIYDEELNSIKKYYELKTKSENESLNDEEKEEFKIYKITANDGLPSNLFHIELQEKGIDFIDLYKSNLSYTNYLKSNEKSFKNNNYKKANFKDEDLEILKKYWKHIIIGLIGIILLFTFLKKSDIKKAESAKALNHQLEIKMIDINKLIIQKKYEDALNLAKDLNHPDHIIVTSKSELFKEQHYDTYWKSVQDSIVNVILKKYKKK